MTQPHKGRHRLSRIALVAALVMLIAGDAPQQWRELKAQVEEAYRAGDYALGVALTERAYQLARQRFGPRHPDTLTSLNNLAFFYDAQGRYGEAEPLYREALQARRETLGPRHPHTLTSLNNLAGLYRAQGSYGEAEPLYKEALQTSHEVLGPRHPHTLQILNNLAELYRAQGRYGEAEPLLREALQARRETLGLRHPRTLLSLNSLAALYHAQGRYGEAEPLYREALQASRETLGLRHPDTLLSLNSLAVLYQAQGRYGEAEPLLREALQARRETLGPRHPDTFRSLNNLAALYHAQGRYGEAEPLLKEALQGYREAHGPRHPDTLISLNNLAELYDAQGRYGEAEPLLREALQASRETLGFRHPHTLTSLNNLAALYQAQGRYGEAEPLLKEALQGHRDVLGHRHPDTLSSLSNLGALCQAQGRYGEAKPLLKEAMQGRSGVLGHRHPDTLRTQLIMVALLVNENRPQEAVRTLQEIEPNLLSWIGLELYSTEGGAVRRQLVSSQATFQNIVLTLATAGGSAADARWLAGTMMVRWKYMQGEDEAFLARLARRSPDPHVRDLMREIAEQRSRLAALAQAGKSDAATKALAGLEENELALGRISPEYKQNLVERTVNLEAVRATLPPGAGLIEFRQFQPFDFRADEWSEPHWAAMLLVAGADPLVMDVGPVADSYKHLAALLGGAAKADSDQAAQALQKALFGPFEAKLAALKTVYVAPDGLLYLVPFGRLKLPDGRYWQERQEVRQLQTGRDLIRPKPDRPAHGLLALGGIDFDAGGAPAKADAAADSAFLSQADVAALATARTRAKDIFRDGFKVLLASKDEAEQVTKWYQRLRKDEPAEAWLGPAASEARLKALDRPPRVLHLATHGFYPRPDGRAPMLLSGVALAGANRALAGQGEDGILYSLEAASLNLDGTELVVLSACETAKGSPDYSEGVFGLARALRIAGAGRVLVTLWRLNDGEARDLMIAFYKNWLGQERSDPAKALWATQLAYINHENQALRDPRVWAPYVLIE